MARRLKLPETGLRAKRRKRRTVRLTMVGVSFLLLIGGVVGVMWLPQIRIWKIETTGIQSFPTDTIVSFVKTQLSGTYFHLVPKNTILFYPKKEIASALLLQFPEFKTATVRAEGLQTISVTVTERGPVAIWCASASSSVCYLLDAEAHAYAPAANFGGEAYRQYMGTLSSSTTPPQFLTPATFRSLFALVDALARVRSGDDIQTILVDQNNDVHATFASGFILLFTLGDDPADIYQRYTLALASVPFTQHAMSDFQYLDIRFGDKLYYKLKNQ